MKHSIKRVQSQAGLSFAEREDVRPKVKQKLLFLLVLLLTATTGAWAQTQWTSGSCTVTLSNGTLTVSGNGAMADYTDPSNRPWINNKGDITSVVVESGVTSVGTYAFVDFSTMTSVTLPEGLTAIGEMAFYSCSSLQSITIPSTVTSIGAGVFWSCTAMTSITLPEGLTAIGAATFYDCSSLTSITLPEGLTAIESMAFGSCSSLTSVTIPSTVTSIGDFAFMSGSAISDVNLYANPDNLTWGDTSMDFMSGNATKCHVLAEHLSTYQNKFSSVNVTFVGDLKPLTPTTYSVTLAEGTEDADKWNVKAGEGEAQAFPVEGLEGGEKITATYSGKKKVKSVKAVKKAAGKTVDLSTYSGDSYEVTEDVTFTGTTNNAISILYKGEGYEVTLDNVNAPKCFIAAKDDYYNINVKLKGTSRLMGIYTQNAYIIIGEAEAGGTVILVDEDIPLGSPGTTITINGGTVKAKSSSYSALDSSLEVNGGAVYLEAGEDNVASASASGSVTLYGWNGSAWETYSDHRYLSTDNSKAPSEWTW